MKGERIYLSFYMILYVFTFGVVSSTSSYHDSFWLVIINSGVHAFSLLVMVLYLFKVYFKKLANFIGSYFVFILALNDFLIIMYHYFFIPNGSPPIWWILFSFLMNIIYNTPAWFFCYRYAKKGLLLKP